MLSDVKKMKAMQTSRGNGLNERIINASSLEDKYQLLKSEANFSLDKALASVKSKRGNTLRARIFYHLNNSWLYLIGAALLAIVAWFING